MEREWSAQPTWTGAIGERKGAETDRDGVGRDMRQKEEIKLERRMGCGQDPF